MISITTTNCIKDILTKKDCLPCIDYACRDCIFYCYANDLWKASCDKSLVSHLYDDGLYSSINRNKFIGYVEGKTGMSILEILL
jgi:hypothetical protein